MTDFNSADPFAASLAHAFSSRTSAPQGYAEGGDVGPMPWRNSEDAFGALLKSGVMPGGVASPAFMGGAAGAAKAAGPFAGALGGIAGLTSGTPWGILGSLALNIGAGIYEKLFTDDDPGALVGNLRQKDYDSAKSWTNQWNKQYGFDPQRDWNPNNQDQNADRNYLDVLTGRKSGGKPTYYVGYSDPANRPFGYDALKAARATGNLGGGGDGGPGGVGGPGGGTGPGPGDSGPGPGDSGPDGGAGAAGAGPGDAGWAKGGIAGLGYSPASAPHSGYTTGPGTGTSDSIPAKLSDGEFVFTAKAVKNAGGGNPVAGAQKLYRQMRFLERTGRGVG